MVEVFELLVRVASPRSSNTSLPRRRIATWSVRPAIASRSWVTTTTIAPSVSQRAELLAERERAVAIEAGERLVEQQQRRLREQRAGEREPLQHAARVRARRAVARASVEADADRAPRSIAASLPSMS